MSFSFSRLLPAAIAGGCCVCAATAARATDTVEPVLIELFLSQSCKASPPAADLAAAYSARDDLVTLVFHVGYWDMMPGREGGAWSDPFSKPTFADRHRLYNKRLRGKNRGMTPQAVVNGAATVSATKATAVAKLIDAALAEEKSGAPHISFDGRDGSLSIAIEGGGGEAVLVRFLKATVTAIEGGDNDGLVFREANVVTGVTPLGAILAQSATFNVAAPDDDSGCAVIIQEPGQGRVIAAGYCPQ
ncbi:MAG: DUF1223 domain-containing protein [Amphiplicatus sp.]